VGTVGTEYVAAPGFVVNVDDCEASLAEGCEVHAETVTAHAAKIAAMALQCSALGRIPTPQATARHVPSRERAQHCSAHAPVGAAR
jgi:hypothetical protein